MCNNGYNYSWDYELHYKAYLMHYNYFYYALALYINALSKELLFLEEVPCAHQGCIYLTYSDIVKYYYNLEGLFSVLNIWNVMYSCGCKVKFSAAISPVLSDPSEIIPVWKIIIKM